jgi:hypothetical protein
MKRRYPVRRSITGSERRLLHTFQLQLETIALPALVRPLRLPIDGAFQLL